MQVGYNDPMKQPSTETGTVKKPAAKQVLVGVRVSPNFHRRIHTECVRRGQSLQDLVTTALEFYFKTTVSQPAVSNSPYVELKPPPGGFKLMAATAQEFQAWLGLWEKYVEQMPREKIDIMVNAMEWDLLTQKSSRRKNGVKRRGQERS